MSQEYVADKFIAENYPERYDQYRRLKYGINEIAASNIMNPLKMSELDAQTPEVHLAKLFVDPSYAYFTCKHIFNQEIMPYQGFIIKETYNHALPMLIASRGAGKSYLLALYALYYAWLKQGSTVIIVGAGFRQSKMVFEYCEKIWHQADVLRDILGPRGLRGEENGPAHATDKCTMILGQSQVIAIPVGVGGEKIRGFRSNCTVSDEFDSHLLDVYEKVIKGFSSVSENPVEKVNTRKAIKAMIKLGIDPREAGIILQESFNQQIISGTASYVYNNLGMYYKTYKAIIQSAGDPKKLQQEIPDDYERYVEVNPKDYCIFRIPYDMLPDEYMDKTSISSAKAGTSSDIFASEYGAVFLGDSSGFFSRKRIDEATTKQPINGIQFMPRFTGLKDAEYVMGVDPASENDNFAIVILEVFKTHKRIVYCYTTNRKKFAKDKSLTKDELNNFYAFAAKKISELCRQFNVVGFGMDGDGGGRTVRDELRTNKEYPVYELIDPKDPKSTDIMQGPHILEIINFQDYEWVSNANHNLKRDIADKNLLFPHYDSYAIAAQAELTGGFKKMEELGIKFSDEDATVTEDSFEYLYDEIEAMKQELTMIVRTQTPNGREKWGLPTTKEANMPKGRLKKDRYSAVLIANAIANELIKTKDNVKQEPSIYGMLASNMPQLNRKGGEMYMGNNFIAIQQLNKACGRLVNRD